MIFTGVEILFYLLGVISTLGVIALIYYNRKYKFKVGAWTTLVIGLFLFIFTIAWSVSSVLEGEPRASSMGMLIFGIPSIILLVLGRRIAVKKQV